jgi:hypothetical protein
VNNKNSTPSLIVLLLTVVSVMPNCNANTIDTSGKQRDDGNLRHTGAVTGQVLITGGYGGNNNVSSNAWIYRG